MNRHTTALLALLLTLQLSVVFADRFNKELDDHFSRVYDFRCDEPRPRAITIQQLAPGQPPGRKYQPEMTVLHRCDASTGCCRGGEVCNVATEEEVGLPFLVTLADNEDFNQHPMGRTIIEYFTATNHTRCRCHNETSSTTQ